MSAAWLVYIAGVSTLFALAAHAAESVALLYGRASRWVWATALGATLLVPLAAFVVQRVSPRLSAPAVPFVSEDVSAETPPTGAFVPQPATSSEPTPRRFDLPRAALAVAMPPSAMATRDALALGWGVLSLGALLFLIGAHAHLVRARRRWTAGRVCDADVLVSRDAGPAALGIRHPAIVVPEWLLRSDDVVQRMVVRHEREHLRTRDPLLLACGSLAVALVPWNPVTWWILFRLRSAVEVDCDRRVLRGGTDARAYGDMLLGVAGRSSRLSFAVALGESPSLLERRIRVMTRGLVRFRSLRAIVLCAVALMASGFAFHADAPAWQPGLRLELRTTVDGHVVEFGEIGAIIADDEGRMYVADVLPDIGQEIVILDPAGNRVGAMGRRGSGPGEFSRLLPTLAWTGDTLLALDFTPAARRLVRFEKSGRVVDTSSPEQRRSWVRMFTGGQSVYVMDLARPPGTSLVQDPDNPRPIPDPVPGYRALTRDGEYTALPALRDSAAAVGIRTAANGVSCRSHDRKWLAGFYFPFTDRGPLRAFTPSGELAKAHHELYRIDIIDPGSGSVLRTIRREVPRVPLTDADWEAMPEIRLLRWYEEEWGGRLVGLGSPAPSCPIYDMRPEYHPAIRTLLTDEQGRFWVEESSDNGFDLALFSADGQFLGEAPMPERDPNVTPYVRGSLLYIVTKDELDVQGIQVYEVHRD